MRTLLRFCIIVIALSAGSVCSAQNFGSFNPNDDLFKYEVKLIDEFIERFNDDSDSYLRKAYKKEQKPYNISRSQLLVSLFDLQNTSFTNNDTTLKGFFRQVLDRNHPTYLSFNDSEWYAEATAVFASGVKLTEIPVFLHITYNPAEGWAKWMIAGIGKKGKMIPGKPMAVLPTPNTKDNFIPTSAYLSRFVGLHYVLDTSLIPEVFFDPACLNSPAGAAFAAEVKAGKLQFQYVKNLQFHFLQVKGWQFTVAQFDRKINNSGWLISNIQKVAANAPVAARNKLLNR
jgi:hypothetical protein